MGRALRAALVLVVIVGGGLGSMVVARATISGSCTGKSGCTNVQQGDNRATTNESGESKSGSAVGGQVTGVVSAGRTSVDARNTSSNSDVSSGDAHGHNSADGFTGLNDAATTGIGATGGLAGGDLADIIGVGSAANVQEGDNRSTFTQAASATTGDGVAGQVIGAVTSTGGSSSIVASNRSDNVDVNSGNADAYSDRSAFTGLNQSFPGGTIVAADITGSCGGCDNVQQGSNRTTSSQTATAHTGDGVAGQVIGAVSAGATSIDANNTSTDSSVQTGNAEAADGVASFTGLDSESGLVVGPSDIATTCTTNGCFNVQQGGNTSTFRQTSAATSGDGVAGEVIGAVTSAGGSASIVAANTSTNNDVITGAASSSNDDAAFVGLTQSNGQATIVGADITGSCAGNFCDNVQEGNNRLTGAQTATSHTGDGVAGQVLGVVSAGAASLDATNRSVDNSVHTGDASTTNAASAFVGLNDAGSTAIGSGTSSGASGQTGDITSAVGENLQQGNNNKTLSQTADATSGDGVAGQVSGVVTSAGGSASVVLANTSTSIDSTSGESRFDNTDNGFVGLNDGTGPITVV